MRILLTGATGQLGKALLPRLRELGEVVPAGRAECDFTSVDAVRRLVKEVRPAVVVNPAAYTAVNEAESQPELAHTINCTAAGALAEAARESSAMFLHYSTDYVFNGRKVGPYLESDETSPLNVYGASKLAGEGAVAAVGGRYLILRTSWVYGAEGNNFLQTIRRLAHEREELRIVNDQVGGPTSTAQIARASVELARKYADVSGDRFHSGVYHMTASGTVSWCGFAEAIVAALGKTETFKLKRIVGIQSSEYPTPALRPLNSVLCNDLFEHTFGFRLENWESGLDEVIRDIHLRELQGCQQ